MTFYELLTILISIIAIIISTVSLVRTRKIAMEQIELEKITAELSRLQIKEIAEQEELKTKPQLNVEITTIGKETNFVIANTGKGSAYNLDIELIGCTDNPLLSPEEKLPCPEMKPNSRIKLFAAMHMNSPISYQVKLIWQEASGVQKSEIFWVSR